MSRRFVWWVESGSIRWAAAGKRWRVGGGGPKSICHLSVQFRAVWGDVHSFWTLKTFWENLLQTCLPVPLLLLPVSPWARQLSSSCRRVAWWLGPVPAANPKLTLHSALAAQLLSEFFIKQNLAGKWCRYTFVLKTTWLPKIKWSQSKVKT